jgi:PAS domain S-box-containing protein
MNSLENFILFGALEAARIGLCAINAEGDVVVLTSEFARKINQSPSEILGRNARRLLAGERFFVPNFSELIDLAGPEIASQATQTSGHQVSIILLRGTTLVHPTLGKYRILTILDILDFGISPTRLLETRRQLDAMRSAVVISDLSKEDNPICFVNRRFEEMTGYHATEVLGRNCRFLQGTERGQEGIAELRAALAARRSHHVVLKNFRKNGEAFLNELFVTPVFDATGQATHYMGLQKEFGDRQLDL